MLQQTGDKELLQRFESMNAEENAWINNCSTQYLRLKLTEMDRLTWNIRKKDISYVTSLYMYYSMKPDEAYSNTSEIKQLKTRGDEALARKNPDEILNIVYRMYELLIDKNQEETIKGTGLRG